MEDEKLAKAAAESGPMNPPKKNHLLDDLVSVIPAKHQDLVIDLTLGAIGILWLVDMVIPDPLPLVDEAGLAYLFYLIWNLRRQRQKGNQTPLD